MLPNRCELRWQCHRDTLQYFKSIILKPIHSHLHSCFHFVISTFSSDSAGNRSEQNSTEQYNVTCHELILLLPPHYAASYTVKNTAQYLVPAPIPARAPVLE